MKRAEDMMREDWEFLKDFNAAVDALQKRQEEFQVETTRFWISLFTVPRGEI